MGILSELVPSGILPEMSDGLQVSYSAIGLLVSIYAIASAVGTIPFSDSNHADESENSYF